MGPTPFIASATTGSAANPGRCRHLPTMMVRRVVGTVRALAPTSMLCPACPPSPAPRRDQPPTPATAPRMVRRSLSVRRPGLSPPRRSCILLAAARPLSLRTHATTLCYVPLNERTFQRCNRGYMVAEPSSDTPLSCRSSSHGASSQLPRCLPRWGVFGSNRAAAA
jgi:hypothetical protein